MKMPQREIDRFVSSKAGWIDKHMAEIERQRKSRAEHAASHTDEERRDAANRLREKAMSILPGRVSLFAERMGVTPKRVRITSARTRWGSCSGAGNISFSRFLMLAEPGTIDYVVIHELAHLKQLNHSPKFWEIVSAYCPDYQVHRGKLRTLHKQILSEEWI